MGRTGKLASGNIAKGSRVPHAARRAFCYFKRLRKALVQLGGYSLRTAPLSFFTQQSYRDAAELCKTESVGFPKVICLNLNGR